MPRTKTLQTGKDKDGKHRKETKEERRARLQSQEDARRACEKLIPYIAAGVFLFLLIFAIYVKSLPPKDSSSSSRVLNEEPTISQLEQVQQEMLLQQAAAASGGGGGDAEAAAANQAALDEAMRMLKEREKPEKTKEEEVMEL